MVAKKEGLVMRQEELVVVQKTLDLLETGQEAVEYIQSSIKTANYEESSSMLADLMEMFDAVESALQPILPQIPNRNEINDANKKLRNAFARIVGCDAINEHQSLSLLTDEVLTLEYNNWCMVLREHLFNYAGQ